MLPYSTEGPQIDDVGLELTVVASADSNSLEIALIVGIFWQESCLVFSASNIYHETKMVQL